MAQIALCIGVFVFASSSPPAYAQQPTSSAPQPSVAPQSWLFAPPTDSVQWSRFHVIEQCTAALERVLTAVNAEMAFQGADDRVPDTIRYARRTTIPVDSDYTAVRNVARSCMAQFPLQRLASRELPMAFNLYFAAHDDARLDSLVERQIVELHTTSQEAKAGVLSNVIGKTVMESQITHHDRRPELAKRYMDAMNTRFPGAVFPRAFRTLFQSRLFGSFDTTQTTADDLIGIVKSVRTILADKPSEPFTDAVKSSLQSLDSLAVKALGYAALLNEGTAAWARLSEHCDTICGDAPWAEFKVPLPPMTGVYWYRDGNALPVADANDGTGASKTSPLLPTGQSRKGHPTIVVISDEHLPPEDVMWVYDLQREFPELDVTIVESTTGYQRGTGLPVSPAVEADSEQKYIFKTLNLRATLVIDSSSHKTLASPDNRWLRAPGPTVTRFTKAGLGGRFILDAQGRVVFDNARDLLGVAGMNKNLSRSVMRKLMSEMQDSKIVAH